MWRWLIILIRSEVNDVCPSSGLARQRIKKNYHAINSALRSAQVWFETGNDALSCTDEEEERVEVGKRGSSCC